MSPHLFIAKFHSGIFLSVLFLVSFLTGAPGQQEGSGTHSQTAVLPYPLYLSHKAIAEATAKHLPIAWVYGSRADFQAQGEVPAGSSADLTQITFGYLGRMRRDLVIVAVIGKGSLNQLPTALRDQFSIPDDGPLSDSDADIPTPKVVLTDSSGEVALTRVSASQLSAMRETAIYNSVYSVLHNPADLRILSHGGPEKTVFTEPTQPVKVEPQSTQTLFLTFVWNVGEFFVILLVVLGGIMFLVSFNWTSTTKPAETVPSSTAESARKVK